MTGLKLCAEFIQGLGCSGISQPSSVGGTAVIFHIENCKGVAEVEICQM